MLIKTLICLLGCTALIVTTFWFPNLEDQFQNILFGILCTLMGLALITLIFKNSWFKSASKFIKKEQHKADVLVVDDNQANRRMIQELLNRLSISCQTAADGAGALTEFKRRSFRLIFMDIEMGVMSGLETVQNMRQLEQKQQAEDHFSNNSENCSEENTQAIRIPIIAVSAHTDLEKKLEALSAGFDDFLSKPLSENTLRDTLDRWINDNLQESAEDLLLQATKSNQKPASLVQTKKASIVKLENRLEERAIIESNNGLPSNVDSSTGTKNEKVVDITLSLTQSHHNHELAKDMLTMLIVMISKEKNRFIELHKKNDWPALKELVHKLKGGCCYCGVPELQHQVEKLENALKQDDKNVISRNFGELLSAMDNLLSWNNEYDIDIIFSTDK